MASATQDNGFYDIWDNVLGFCQDRYEEAKQFVETIQDSEFLQNIGENFDGIYDKFVEITDFDKDGKSDIIEWGKDFLSNEVGMYLNLDKDGVDNIRSGLDWIEDKTKDLGNFLKENLNEEFDYDNNGKFELSEDLKAFLKDSGIVVKVDELEEYVSNGDALKDIQNFINNAKEEIKESDIVKEFSNIFNKDNDFDRLFDKDNVREFVEDISDVAKDIAEAAKETVEKIKQSEEEFDI